MTTDHLRPLLDEVRDLHLLFSVREQLATGKEPQEVVEIGRMGRLTALKKPNGRIRGIVSGEVVRRLVSRTITQQVSKAVEAGTAPFQCALSTKAGSDCVAHALQALCELDPSSTVVVRRRNWGIRPRFRHVARIAPDCSTRRSLRQAVLWHPFNKLVGERRGCHPPRTPRRRRRTG